MLTDKYILDSYISSGSLGEVLMAMNKETGKRVLIKKTIEKQSNIASNAILENEQRIMEILNGYEYFPYFIEFFKEDGYSYLVQEYFVGHSLQNILDEKKKLSLSSCVYLARQILLAISIIHRNKIIHKDIKPSNILVSKNGQVKIADFGISRVIGENNPPLWGVVGTPMYMAPEQFKEFIVEPTSDLYSFGIILYQCVFGEIPYKSKDMKSLISEKGDLEISINGISPMYKEILNIIKRMLHVNPNSRIQSADEALSMIDEFVENWGIRIDKEIFLNESMVGIGEFSDDETHQIVQEDSLLLKTVIDLERKLDEIRIEQQRINQENKEIKQNEALNPFKELKVFISSTMKDLQEERDVVEEVIKELGLSVVRAEKFGSPGMTSHEVCMRAAKECDIYIGVFGLRFGWTPPNETRSVTEMEFDEAKYHDPSKLLIYIKEGEVTEEEQKRFRNKVSDYYQGYFRATYTTVEQLSKQVKTDIPTWIVNRIKMGIRNK